MSDTLSCERIDTRLSGYYDRELPPGERRSLEGHLRACSRCRSELRALESTSRMLAREGRSIPAPPPFDELRARLERPVGVSRAPKVAVRVLLAASVVAALGLGVLMLRVPDELAGSAGSETVAGPELRTAGLPGLEAFLAQHGAEPIAPAELAERVSFQPTAPETLAGGYRLERSFVVRDRCSTGSCLIYRRGEELVTLIQQNPRHPVRWANAALREGRFAGRACRTARAAGVRVVQLEPAGRNLTIVAREGAADLERIVDRLAAP